MKESRRAQNFVRHMPRPFVGLFAVDGRRPDFFRGNLSALSSPSSSCPMRFHKPEHLRYRPEIDGLRAVAVLSVILYHANVPYIVGGFTGVDIFYVISGYLITKIIVDGLTQGRFSFPEFYARRIKRLLPAALLMVVVCVIFGALILTPDKYVELAKSAIYSSVFLANVWFMNNSGYFDQPTEVAPLVHMWSLAVEEQFYLVFPLMLFVIYRAWGLKGIKVAIPAIFFLSLLLSIALSERFPNFAFYMLPTRAWELSVGALLVLFPALLPARRSLCGPLSFLGAALVGFSLVGIPQTSIYPGYLAMAPTLGAALIIASSHTSGSIAHIVLTARPMVLIGKFSYSAYLWHWPLVVYYRVYVSERSFSLMETICLVVASLVAGYLSWRFVEERFRYQKLSFGHVFRNAAIATSVVIAAPAVVYLQDGFPGRITDEARAFTDADQMWHWECTEYLKPFDPAGESFCVVGANWTSASRRGILWGDSHSLHWAPIFHRLAKMKNISFVIAPLECPPYLNSAYIREDYPKFPRFTEDCTVKQSKTIDWLNSHPEVDIIVMAAAWSGHVRMVYVDSSVDDEHDTPLIQRSGNSGAKLSADALRRTIADLDLKNKRLLLLGDVPRPNRNLNECAFNEMSLLLRARCPEPYGFLDAAQIKAWHRPSDGMLKDISAESAAIDVILPVERLCGEARCPTVINGEMIYKDSNHIRRNLATATFAELEELIGLRHYFETL